jgi:hypothetical protein
MNPKMTVKVLNNKGRKLFYLYELQAENRATFENDIQDFLGYSGNDDIDVSILVNGYQVDYLNNYNKQIDKNQFKMDVMQLINLVMFSLLYASYDYKMEV